MQAHARQAQGTASGPSAEPTNASARAGDQALDSNNSHRQHGRSHSRSRNQAAEQGGAAAGAALPAPGAELAQPQHRSGGNPSGNNHSEASGHAAAPDARRGEDAMRPRLGRHSAHIVNSILSGIRPVTAGPASQGAPVAGAGGSDARGRHGAGAAANGSSAGRSEQQSGGRPGRSHSRNRSHSQTRQGGGHDASASQPAPPRKQGPGANAPGSSGAVGEQHDAYTAPRWQPDRYQQQVNGRRGSAGGYGHSSSIQHSGGNSSSYHGGGSGSGYGGGRTPGRPGSAQQRSGSRPRTQAAAGPAVASGVAAVLDVPDADAPPPAARALQFEDSQQAYQSLMKETRAKLVQMVLWLQARASRFGSCLAYLCLWLLLLPSATAMATCAVQRCCAWPLM